MQRPLTPSGVDYGIGAPRKTTVSSKVVNFEQSDWFVLFYDPEDVTDTAARPWGRAAALIQLPLLTFV
jgi:hypothetical protein